VYYALLSEDPWGSSR